MNTKRLHQGILALASAAALSMAVSSANADIIFDKNITGLGQGFGAVPRLLTTETGKPGTESACDSNVGGTLSTTTCSGLDASFQPNGYIDLGGNDVTGPKNALVNLSAAGFTDATDIVIIYNPSQTGANPTTDIKDLLLKFYDANNNLVISVDGGCGASCTNTSADPLYFGDTGVNLGNGGTGFALILDATQAAAVNAACGVDLANCVTLAAEVTILDANDGPDSFYLFHLSDVCDPNIPGDCPGPTNVPEPLTLSLFGAGLAAAAAFSRRRKRT